LVAPRDAPTPVEADPAPARPRRATYVAVPADGLADDDGDPLRGPRVDVEARLASAAARAVTAALPALTAAAWLASAAALAVVLPTRVAWPVDAVVILLGLGALALGWRFARRQRRGADLRGATLWRVAATIGFMSPTLLFAWPGMLDAPVRFAFVGLIVALLSLASAALLAARRPLALAAAAWPAWVALAAAVSARAEVAWMVPGGALAAAAGAGLAALLHRAWRIQTRALIERDVRIEAIGLERDRARRADQEKSRFLAIASHDLRQPVHAIGLFAATLEKRVQGSDQEPLVRNMIRAIDGLDRSFNAMLDVSRLDAGTIEPNVQRFALRDLFRRLHMHFAGQAEARDLGLRFSPGGKSVSSDPQLLERILGNLVQNALKYTERGGVVVVARSTRTHLNVEVWDTGSGIAEPDLARVFDEFVQVGRGERARTQGLGMGLAIVKRLSRLLGHTLTVASRPGQGTMFRVGIALGGLGDLQDATAAADTLPMEVSDSRTVLVIDDEEAIREGLRLLLEEWGYEAITAGSALSAERAIASLAIVPDLILSDLHLGDGPDGIAAIQAVRRQCGHDVHAVLITGDTTPEEMRRVTESGLPVMFKPVQPRKLYNALRGLMS